jgi:hypothetical protein
MSILSSSRILRASLALITLLAVALPQTHAYSVLTHEEVVDMVWTSNIVPLLKERFPDASVDDLRIAHAYAYGGSVIQDIGYYPFGSHYFSDLMHYVRTGDFVSTLIADSSDINEYAFALGALAHYCGDTIGHPYINQTTAREYPLLRKRFGTSVTYEENPLAHIRTEFGFDVVQVAHSRFASDAYRDFIGFQVAKPLLDRAFAETYGLKVVDVMSHEDLAIGSYRRSVSKLIPKMTRVALVAYRKQLQAEDPSFNSRKFIYRVKKSQYRRQYGSVYKEPDFGAHVVAFFVRCMPKVGPFRSLRLSLPNAQEEDIYLKSVNLAVDNYTSYLVQLKHPSAVENGLVLPDLNLDTGRPTAPGEYRLADFSYAHLLKQITATRAPQIPSSLHQSLLTYYASTAMPATFLSKPKQWQQVQASLVILRSIPLTTTPLANSR